MWLPAGSGAGAASSSLSPMKNDDEEDEAAHKHDATIKIAWRYEQMKQFQTTVPSSTQYVVSFDLNQEHEINNGVIIWLFDVD